MGGSGTSWLICFGLLAASGVIAGVAALVWLISGSETILTLGLGGGLLLGIAGVWHLLRHLGRTYVFDHPLVDVQTC